MLPPRAILLADAGAHLGWLGYYVELEEGQNFRKAGAFGPDGRAHQRRARREGGPPRPHRGRRLRRRLLLALRLRADDRRRARHPGHLGDLRRRASSSSSRSTRSPRTWRPAWSSSRTPTSRPTRGPAARTATRCESLEEFEDAFAAALALRPAHGDRRTHHPLGHPALQPVAGGGRPRGRRDPRSEVPRGMSQQLERNRSASQDGREARAWRLAGTWQETPIGGSAEAERVGVRAAWRARSCACSSPTQKKASRHGVPHGVDRAFHAKSTLAVDDAELRFRRRPAAEDLAGRVRPARARRTGRSCASPTPSGIAAGRLRAGPARRGAARARRRRGRRTTC